jgi:hypothetical protein
VLSTITTKAIKLFGQLVLLCTLLDSNFHLDDMIRETQTQFQTEEAPPEVLDIEWNRLKPMDQFDELAAVIFDIDTQIKANQVGLKIPNLDSLEKWLDAIEEGELSGNESEVCYLLIILLILV